MAGDARWRSSATPTGAHVLSDRAASRLVRDAGVEASDLVLDLGAGSGAVTRLLARSGARVIAVERDTRVARWLRARMRAHPKVSVVEADALAVPLPRRSYRVVANIPFAITTPLLHRLVASPMVAADLVVELGAGRRLTGDGTARPALARWYRQFEFTLGPVIPAHEFRPAPPVHAVVLKLRRRTASRTGGGPATAERSRRSGRAGR